jgi:hypothetical protein
MDDGSAEPDGGTPVGSLDGLVLTDPGPWTQPGARWSYRFRSPDAQVEATRTVVRVEPGPADDVVFSVAEDRIGNWQARHVFQLDPAALRHRLRIGGELDPPPTLLPLPARMGDRWHETALNEADGLETTECEVIGARRVHVGAGIFDTLEVRTRTTVDGHLAGEQIAYWAEAVGPVLIHQVGLDQDTWHRYELTALQVPGGASLPADAASTRPAAIAAREMFCATCGSHATCDPTASGTLCTCIAGFAPVGPPDSLCANFNECASGAAARCDPDATCHDLFGSYDCLCPAGTVGDGTSCTTSPCSEASSHGCHAHAFCSDQPLGHVCVCEPGYAGDGRSCASLDGAPFPPDFFHHPLFGDTGFMVQGDYWATRGLNGVTFSLYIDRENYPSVAGSFATYPDREHTFLAERDAGWQPAHVSVYLGRYFSVIWKKARVPFVSELGLTESQYLARHEALMEQGYVLVDFFSWFDNTPERLNAATWEYRPFLRTAVHRDITPHAYLMLHAQYEVQGMQVRDVACYTDRSGTPLITAVWDDGFGERYATVSLPEQETLLAYHEARARGFRIERIHGYARDLYCTLYIRP